MSPAGFPGGPHPTATPHGAGAPQPRTGAAAPFGTPGTRPAQQFTDPFPHPRPNAVERILRSARRQRILRHEGPRGLVTRSSIWIRYVAYFLTIVLASALTDAMLTRANSTELGGKFMLFAAAMMAVTAAGGCVLYPTHRDMVIEELRHYMFGLCLFPATGLAAIIWAMQSMLSNPAANTDTMMQLLNFSVPVVFACTLIIPPAMFIKVVAGAQTLHRSTLDDEEMVAMYTRQDGHQR